MITTRYSQGILRRVPCECHNQSLLTTSDQIQPCDLGIFSNQKRWQRNIRVDDGLNKQTKQVIRIVDSYRMATTAKNVVSAFRKGGIVTYVDRDKMQLKVRVDIGKATAVRHYAHLHAEDANGTQRVKIWNLPFKLFECSTRFSKSEERSRLLPKRNVIQYMHVVNRLSIVLVCVHR